MRVTITQKLNYKTERVFASSGSLTPREAAGRPGKTASDSYLLPCLICEWLCINYKIDMDLYFVYSWHGKVFLLLFIFLFSFKHLGVLVTGINNIRKKIKCKINMGNAYYYSLEIIKISILLIICEAFTSKALLHFWKQKKVRRCQIRTVWNNSHSFLCTYHVTSSDVQLHKAIFNIILNTRNQWSAATKQMRGLYAQSFFIFWMTLLNYIYINAMFLS